MGLLGSSQEAERNYDFGPEHVYYLVEVIQPMRLKSCHQGGGANTLLQKLRSVFQTGSHPKHHVTTEHDVTLMTGGELGPL